MSNFEKKNHETSQVSFCISDLEEVLDRLPMGIFKSDEKGNLIYMNEYLAKLIPEQQREKSKEVNSLEHHINYVVKECLTGGKSSFAETKPFENSKGEQTFLALEAINLKNNIEKPINGELADISTSEWSRSRGVVGVVEDISEKARLEKSLKKKISELSIICEVGNALRSTLNLEEILEIILIGVTAGQGLGFNRAFLLLLNEEEKLLEGKIAIGPSNPAEAKRIWEDLSTKKQSLEEVLHSYKDALRKKDILVNDLVKKLRISSSDQKNFLIQSMQQKKALSVRKDETDSETNKSIFEILGADSLAVVPLVFKDKVNGVLLADNSINQKPIEEEDVKLMQIFAHHVSTAIESSKLYQKLAEQVNKLEEANQRIAENTQRLLRAEKLSVLGEITSQVAHELRNPMTIIGGFARSLLKKKDVQDSDYEYMKIIAQETERVEKVLDNVLNFTKPEKANLEKVDLNQIVDQTLEMMEGEINSDKITVMKCSHPDLPRVMVNPDQIRHALLNIFRNAIWAMPQGGILSITTKKKGSFAKVEIKDTGFGIPKEHMGSIFDAFFTTKPESSGLGLTISSEIIKNHGGLILAESEKGKGSTFSVLLPFEGNFAEDSIKSLNLGEEDEKRK
jgi:signal transduction histidine kinase